MKDNRQERKPIVSFIIPYYELPVNLLCECIDSILSLSLNKEERQIIVIDDGSRNNPLPALKPYTDDIIYIHQKHQGLSMARNTGVRMASGDYLQFVDADDKLIKTGYDYCLGIIHTHKNADMVLFDFEDSEKEPSFSLSSKVQPTSGISYLRHNNIHGTAWGYIFRRNILGDLRFTSGLYHEDEEFTPQLLIRSEIVYPTKAKAYYYNRRQNSILTSKDTAHVEKRLSDILQVILNLHKIAESLPINEQLALERRVSQLTMDYIYNVIIQTNSLSITHQRIETLRDSGLFPLPDRKYTKKYQAFRYMTNSRLGLSLLVKILPLLKKER